MMRDDEKRLLSSIMEAHALVSGMAERLRLTERDRDTCRGCCDNLQEQVNELTVQLRSARCAIADMGDKLAKAERSRRKKVESTDAVRARLGWAPLTDEQRDENLMELLWRR